MAKWRELLPLCHGAPK